MTEDELREFELIRQTRSAVARIWQSMDGDIAASEHVRNWRREQHFQPMTEEQPEQFHREKCQLIGADVNVELKRKLADGTLVLTVRIMPVTK